MLASWLDRSLASSRVQVMDLATHTLKDIPLETLALAKAFSLVLLTSVRPWLIESTIRVQVFKNTILRYHVGTILGSYSSALALPT